MIHRILNELLPHIISNPNLHARWINTFSYLEYIGFRKIIKSQWAEDISAAVLSHACEEGRHALRLKKMAVKIGGKDFDSYSADKLLCPEQAENYFKILDASCEMALASHFVEPKIVSRLTYLYVTLIVEVRALRVYGDYLDVLKQNGSGQVIEAMLAEEAAHLEYVQRELVELDPHYEQRRLQIEDIERGLYSDYVSAVQREVELSLKKPISIGTKSRRDVLEDHGVCL